jgi:GH25 family lysozyme M1 (1,4-beta-N-acetylmuramidase)
VTTASAYRAVKRRIARSGHVTRTLRRRARRLGGQKVGVFRDVSSNNGPISRSTMESFAKEGGDLIVVKVSEGTSYVNPYAADTIKEAKRAGLVVMPYHFSRPDSGTAPSAEADHFVHSCREVGLRLGPRRKLWFLRDELPGCLDYEENAASGNDEAWIAGFRHAYRNRTHHGVTSWRGKKSSATAGPVLYGGSIVRERVSGTLKLLFWLAAYTSSPDSYWPGSIPQRLRMAWQYTDRKDAEGLGGTDASTFYGRVRDLIRLAI